jgi:hypothetical protein
MFEDILMLFKAIPNLFGSVYGYIIILEYGIIWQQYANHNKKFTIEYVIYLIA